MTYRLIAIVAATFTVIGIHAAEPTDILEGYGKTKWGQSYEEVAAVLPELVNFINNEGYAVYTAAGAEGSVITSVRYEFLGDHLFAAIATFSLPGGPEGNDADAVVFIKKKLGEKYERLSERLNEDGIKITVYPGPLDATRPGGAGAVKVRYENRSARAKGKAAFEKKVADAEAARAEARAESKRFDKIDGEVLDEL